MDVGALCGCGSVGTIAFAGVFVLATTVFRAVVLCFGLRCMTFFAEGFDKDFSVAFSVANDSAFAAGFAAVVAAVVGFVVTT